MEDNTPVGEWIVQVMFKKKLSKRLVYDRAGISQNGFDKMIKNNSMKLDAFVDICKAMEVEPTEYFIYISADNHTSYETSIAAEPLSEYGKRKTIDTETKEFYERQIESLTRIIENLSEKG